MLHASWKNARIWFVEKSGVFDEVDRLIVDPALESIYGTYIDRQYDLQYFPRRLNEGWHKHRVSHD